MLSGLKKIMPKIVLNNKNLKNAVSYFSLHLYPIEYFKTFLEVSNVEYLIYFMLKEFSVENINREMLNH